MRNKLKRDRIPKQNMGYDLFKVEAIPRIVIKEPSASFPSLRKYNRDRTIDVKNAFKRHKIIDARHEKAIPKKFSLRQLKNRIICGDSYEVLKRMPTESINCIITSPPYWNVVDYGMDNQYGQCSYNEYLDQLSRIWRECGRVLKPNGKMCINAPIMPISKKVINNQHTRHVKNMNNDIEASILNNLSSLHIYGLYIWKKQTTEKMFGSYPYPPNIYEQNTIEFVNVFVKSGSPEKVAPKIKEASKLSQKEWMNLTRQIWSLYPDDVKRTNHPASFPVSLPNRLIAMYTFKQVETHEYKFEGNIVLDPFCGTGATCIAAKELGRNYIGIDILPDFCIGAAKRLEKTFYTGTIFLIKDREEQGSLNKPTTEEPTLF